MAERPILFSAPMVRAILDGQKTQTRRVFKEPQPLSPGFEWCFHPTNDGRWELGAIHPSGEGAFHSYIRCPYGVPGDLLYVRESWNAALENPRAFPDEGGVRWWHELPRSMRGPTNAAYLFYRADGVEIYTAGFSDGFDLVEHWEQLTMKEPRTPPRWRPSIHMPKWASRIWLRVAEVALEPLHEISEEGAVAEGVRANPDAPAALTDRTAFARLWDKLNAPRGYGWSLNPPVWVITFERTEAPNGQA